MHIDQLQRVVEWNATAGRERRMRRKDDCESSMKLIDEEYKELKEATDLESTLDALGDLLVVVAGHIDHLGFSPVLTLQAVMDSNDSKWCYSEEDAEKSVEAYKSDTRYTNVHHKKAGDKWVIWGTVVETGKIKILKGIHYKEPDFSEVYAEALRCTAGC